MKESDEKATMPSLKTIPSRASMRRYARDNPLATIAGLAIIGVLLARFAFL